MTIPDKLRITHMAWSERDGAHKVQLGDSDMTIAYVTIPGGSGDKCARDQAFAVAVRICEGWND